MGELWNFIKFHIREANPFKDEQYLWKYIELYEKIQIAKQTHDWRMLCQYGFPFMIICIRLVYYICYNFNSNSSELQMIIYIDIFGLLDFSPINTLIIGINFLLAYIYYIIYFSNKSEYYVESKKHLLSGDVDYFKRHWPFQYKNQQCTSFVQRNTLRIIYILQTFNILAGENYFEIYLIYKSINCLELSITCFTLCYIYYIHRHWDYFSRDINSLGMLLFSNLNFALVIFWCFLFVHGHLIASIVLLSEMLVWNIQLWQLQHQIDCYNQRMPCCPRASYITRTFKKIAIYIFKTGPMFGNFFLAYIPANMPFNGFFTIDILIGKKERLILNSTKYGFLFQQIFGMFIVHFAIARNNSKLSKSIYQIMKIPFHHRISKMQKIRLNLFIEDFYTDNKIGVHYGMFGLITLSAFSKVRFQISFSA